MDPGFLERLADRGLVHRLAEIDGAAGDGQLPWSVRRISRISAASLATTTLTEGTRLLAFGASDG